MPPVEQIKLKRAGTGLRAYDPDRAWHGFTLFAPQTGGGNVYLVDLEGNVVHTWQMPYPPGNYGYLTERGTLFYNGKTPENSDRFISGKPWKGGAALEADWNGRVLWEVQHPDHHHDGIRLRNGNVLLLCLAQLPRDFAAKVQGGMPGTEHNGDMYGDYLVEMTTGGRIVWEYPIWEHLDPETDCITAVQERREEWMHGNGVAELPNGDIVVSFRAISTVIIIDRRTGKIIWKLGAPPLCGQHAPTPLPNGNLLLLCLAKLPRDLVPKIKGGMPGTEHNGEMYADYLVEMTIAGRIVWEWRTWEHFDPESDCITAVQERREEWTHGNGLAELPNGDVVVSFRAISTVIIIERRTVKIIWKLGAPPLSGQHAPMPLANGNLLLFDNGPHRLDHPMPFSRVIEVELATKQIVWKYQEKRESDFFSPRISNAQRLPNGNTLICEGDFGRLFEVTAEGELVWEFVNPFFGEGPTGINNRVFRAYRYSEDEIARAKGGGS